MKRILIVEDSETQRTCLMLLLSQENYWVKACANVAEAYYALVGGTRPDVVMVDFILPDATGLDFIEMVRSVQDGDKAYCVLMTALGPDQLESHRERMNRLRVHVLYKPFEPPNMIEMLRAITSEVL